MDLINYLQRLESVLKRFGVGLSFKKPYNEELDYALKSFWPQWVVQASDLLEEAYLDHSTTELAYNSLIQRDNSEQAKFQARDFLNGLVKNWDLYDLTTLLRLKEILKSHRSENNLKWVLDQPQICFLAFLFLSSIQDSKHYDKFLNHLNAVLDDLIFIKKKPF